MLATPDPLWISRNPGEKVAFLPGMVMAPEFWRHYAPVSSRSGQTAAYPLPAHYPWKTEWRATGLLSTDQIVDAYAAALKRDFALEENAGRVTLVGHSTGGFISLLLAKRYPELVEKLILVGAFGCGRFEGAGRFAMRLLLWPMMGELIFTTLLARWISTPERFRAGSLTCVHRRSKEWFTEPATLVQEEVRQTLAKSDPGEIAALVRWLYRQSIMGELGKIEVPALFIIGSRDSVVPPVHQLSTARRLRNAATVIMPGVGHLPMVEAPAEFDRVVGMFLRVDQAKAPLKLVASALKRQFAVREEDGKFGAGILRGTRAAL